MKTPQNVAFLERGLRKFASTNLEHNQLRTMVANVVLGQFMSGGVLRGGTSLKFRYGLRTTRFTMDFDVARRIGQYDFEDALRRRMEAGWAEFTGTLEVEEKATPKDIPPEYVMQPYRARLNYKNHPWCSVRLEVSYDEIGDADESEFHDVPLEIRQVFEQLGFPEPKGIELMTVPFQAAQKLHGATDPAARRVQDLIDLQLLFKNEKVDLAGVGRICLRLFENRKRQPWPSYVKPTLEWDEAYNHLAEGIDVLRSVTEAAAFVNNLIDQIAEAQ